MFNNDWAVFWYHDCGIDWQRKAITTHQNLSLGKCWKLFWAALNQVASKPNLRQEIEIPLKTRKLKFLVFLVWTRNLTWKYVSQVFFCHWNCTLFSFWSFFVYFPYIDRALVYFFLLYCFLDFWILIRLKRLERTCLQMSTPLLLCKYWRIFQLFNSFRIIFNSTAENIK